MQGWTAGLFVMLLTGGGAAASERRCAEPEVPVISYHQHLMSEATVRLWSQPPLPGVELPVHLASLLRQREQAFGDAAALALLYTPDALLLDPNDPAWIRGQRPVAEHLARTFGRNYRLTPISVEESAGMATVAGYLTRGDAQAPQHFAHVLLSLRKGDDSAWRIATETLLFKPPQSFKPFTARDLIAQLDAAGIRRAVVLSLAYLYGDPRRSVTGEYVQVRAENDWTRNEVARYPDRLIGFCGVSPLRPYAVEEIDRCAQRLHLSGLKLHFGNSGVDLRNADHVEQIRRVFRAANDRNLPIIVHLRTRDRSYGRRDAEIFFEQILPAAPEIPVQIAHLAGAGPGYPAHADEALAVFAEAISAGDPRTKRLYFDVTTVVTMDISTETANQVAQRIRQLGPQRILFGADLATGGADGNPPPLQSWAAFRTMLPLTKAEFATIAGNVTSYLRLPGAESSYISSCPTFAPGG